MKNPERDDLGEPKETAWCPTLGVLGLLVIGWSFVSPRQQAAEAAFRAPQREKQLVEIKGLLRIAVVR